MSKSRWVTGRGEGAGAAIVPPSPPGGGGEEARAPAGRRLWPAHARSGPRRAPLGAVRMPGLGACPRSRPEPIPRTRARSLSPPPPSPESAQAALRTRGRGLLKARARPEAARARASRARPDTRPGPRTRTRAPGLSRARAPWLFLRLETAAAPACSWSLWDTLARSRPRSLQPGARAGMLRPGAARSRSPSLGANARREFAKGVTVGKPGGTGHGLVGAGCRDARVGVTASPQVNVQAGGLSHGSLLWVPLCPGAWAGARGSASLAPASQGHLPSILGW